MNDEARQGMREDPMRSLTHVERPTDCPQRKLSLGRMVRLPCTSLVCMGRGQTSRPRRSLVCDPAATVHLGVGSPTPAQG